MRNLTDYSSTLIAINWHVNLSLMDNYMDKFLVIICEKIKSIAQPNYALRIMNYELIYIRVISVIRCFNNYNVTRSAETGEERK